MVIHLVSLVDHRNTDLPAIWDVPQIEFYAQCLLVSLLQKAGPEGAMHIDRRADHCMSKIVNLPVRFHAGAPSDDVASSVAQIAFCGGRADSRRLFLGRLAAQ